MSRDPSWDILPVASPDLRAGKRRRLVRDALVKDPVGLPEPFVPAGAP